MRVVAGLVGLVALVVVGAVAMGIVTDSSSTSDYASEWSFDDYKAISGATSASGSLELVETSNGVLVHARSVGPGSYTTAEGTVDVIVSKALLDVVLMSGQSNSTYIPWYAENGEASPLPSPGTAYVWAQADGNYSYLYEADADPRMMDMVSPEGVSLTGATAPAFAASYTELTGSKVLFVAGGLASMHVRSFDPSSGTSWTYMQNCLTDALDSIDRSHFTPRGACYLWIQGESDKVTAVDVYKRQFMTMHEAILGGELGMAFNHCFISLPAEDDSTNAYQAQLQLAQEHPGTITVATDLADTFTIENGLLQSDTVHYTQEGYNEIGTALGESAGSYYAENPLPVPKSVSGSALMSLWPVMLAIAVGVMGIIVAVKLVMGRD